MSTHTPGPWWVNSNLSQHRIFSESGFSLCGTFGGLSDGEEEANARLIAAAPDMLEALKVAEMVMQGAGIRGDAPAFAAVRAAIAKATGKD